VGPLRIAVPEIVQVVELLEKIDADPTFIFWG